MHHRRYEVFREVHKVWAFRLAINANIWCCTGEHPMRMLEEAVAEESELKGFDVFLSDPLVMYNPQEFRPNCLYRKEDHLRLTQALPTSLSHLRSHRRSDE